MRGALDALTIALAFKGALSGLEAAGEKLSSSASTWLPPPAPPAESDGESSSETDVEGGNGGFNMLQANEWWRFLDVTDTGGGTTGGGGGVPGGKDISMVAEGSGGGAGILARPNQAVDAAISSSVGGRIAGGRRAMKEPMSGVMQGERGSGDGDGEAVAASEEDQGGTGIAGMLEVRGCRRISVLVRI